MQDSLFDEDIVLERIISGGQTGADRAGLAAALIVGLKTGGWAPKDFLTEEGMNPELGRIYGLKETEGHYYPERTERNVRDSDATVLFATSQDSKGTMLTIRLCKQYKKPYIINPTQEEFISFLKTYLVKTLNVAGNRESLSPGIYKNVLKFLTLALGEL
jgi:hypothetical protein